MIEVQNLVKEFGPKKAVDGVSFTVDKGEVLGFLGPNGAGKSTTMRMITGFIPPTAGGVRIGPHDMLAEPLAAKKLVGYLPESAPLYADMTVHGFLSFAAELRGLTGGAKKKAVHRAIEICFLEGVVHQSIDTLSKGYRHRTGFAQSILHDPDILVLDEPTDGLDPNQKREVRGLIRRMGETKAIVFSTHILEEVEAACTRAIIIDRGKIVANGSPEDLKGRSEDAGAVTVRVIGRESAEVKTKLAAVASARQALIVSSEDRATVARAFPKADLQNGALAQDIAGLVLREGWTIEELRTEQGRLDQVFHAITMSDTDAPAS